MNSSNKVINAEGDFFAEFGQRMLCLSLIQQAASDLARDRMITHKDTAASLRWVMGNQVHNVGRICRSTREHNGQALESLYSSSREASEELESTEVHLISFEMAVDGAGLGDSSGVDMPRALVIQRLRRAIVEHPEVVDRALEGCLREIEAQVRQEWHVTSDESPQVNGDDGDMLDDIAPELMGRMMHGATFASTSGMTLSTAELGAPARRRHDWQVATA